MVQVPPCFVQGKLCRYAIVLFCPSSLRVLRFWRHASGGGISHIIPPPPSGNFTNSNLNGTYVFSVIGSDVNGFPLQLTGTLTADGNGNITGGAFDVNNPNGLGVENLTVGSGSTFVVTADGRGTATVKYWVGSLWLCFCPYVE